MTDFATYARIAAHAADRLEKLKDETGRHGWTVQSKATATEYFTTKHRTAIEMMLRTSPFMLRWRDNDLETAVRMTIAETKQIILPADHQPLVAFMRHQGVTCFVVGFPNPTT